MFRVVGSLKLQHPEELIPAFLTVTLIPLTFSITQGILWGLISHVGLYAVTGRKGELSPVLVAISLVSLGMLGIENI